MKKFRDHSLKEYIEVLSSRSPVPGGGSAAALAGALGSALISMAARYSLNPGLEPQVKKKVRALLAGNEKIKDQLLQLVDRDAEAYLRVVNSRNASAYVKTKALKKARGTSLAICRLCLETIQLTPELVKNGNPHLISDIEVALELLFSSFQSALVNAKINQ